MDALQRDRRWLLFILLGAMASIPGAAPAQLGTDPFAIASDPVAVTFASGNIPTQHVFARNGAGELVHYYWSPALDWSVENLTGRASIGASYRIAGEPVADALVSGATPTQHVFGRNATGDLIHYYWLPGPSWAAENLTGRRNMGAAYRLAGDPAVVNLKSGNTPTQHVFARSETGDLIHYYWSPGPSWAAENLTQRANIGPAYRFVGQPVVVNLKSGNTPTQHVFARSENGDLIHYYWSPGPSWAAENLTQRGNIGPAYRFTGEPEVVNLIRGDTPTQHVFARNDVGDLIHYYWRPAASWAAENLTERSGIGQSFRITGHLAAMNLQSGDTTTQHVFASNAAGELVHYYWSPGPSWAAENLTGRPHIGPAYTLASDPTALGLRVGATMHQRVFGRNAAGDLVQYVWSPRPSWVGDNLTRQDVELPVMLHPQETSMWCWAASGQMTMEYGGRVVAQCDQANHLFDRTNCCQGGRCPPVGTTCAEGGWPEYDAWDFDSKHTNDAALTFEHVATEILLDRPVAFSWGWKGGGGHMMVANGIRRAAGVEWVHILDPGAPCSGDDRVITYADYVARAGHHTHWDDYYEIVRRAAAAPAVAAAAFEPGVGGAAAASPGPDTPLITARGADLNAVARPPVHATPRAAAAATLRDLSAGARDTRARELGLTEADDAQRTEAGEPIREYLVRLDELRRFRRGRDPAKLLHATGGFLVPVVVEGEVRSGITVAQQDGGYAVVAYGDRNLSRRISAQLAGAPREAAREESYVHIPALHVAFVGRTVGRAFSLVPIVDDPRFGFETGKPLPAHVVFERLAPLARGRSANRPG
jgi:hypothetical protein